MKKMAAGIDLPVWARVAGGKERAQAVGEQAKDGRARLRRAGGRVPTLQRTGCAYRSPNHPSRRKIRLSAEVPESAALAPAWRGR